MMEKRGLLALVLAFVILSCISLGSLASASNGACLLNTSLINQDPYPAIPGDYVKLVFQVDGTDNSACGDVSIKLNEEYPFTLDVGAQAVFSTKSFFDRNYQSFLIAPFEIRVDKEALDGANPIEVTVSYEREGTKSTTLEKFYVEIEDKRAEFEVYVKNYDPLTNILTFEILNTGKYDVKAVTLDVPSQENIEIKGSNINIVGDLDSNEYTTADFEAASGGGEINLKITYTDGINARRTIESSVNFNPEYFTGRKAQEKSYTWWYAAGVIIAILACIWVYRAFFRKKQKKVY